MTVKRLIKLDDIEPDIIRIPLFINLMPEGQVTGLAADSTGVKYTGKKSVLIDDDLLKHAKAAYIEVAKLQGEQEAVRSFTWALEAEKIHAKLYREAKEYVDKGQDWPLEGYVWICPVCGHTYVGREPPEKCPICGAPREKYVKF